MLRVPQTRLLMITRLQMTQRATNLKFTNLRYSYQSNDWGNDREGLTGETRQHTWPSRDLLPSSIHILNV